MNTYLSICAIYRNEGRYLREWVEFHRLVGAEHFFLYDNRSTDDHRDVLAPYVEEGIVTAHDWPLFPGQGPAYQHCLDQHGRRSRWIAFLDLDEFLFSPTYSPLPEILRDYEKWPAVGVHWAAFGTSGHRTPPAGLVIENYVRRAADHAKMNEFVKCVVDPSRTLGPRHGWNPHIFDYRSGHAVNERMRSISRRPLKKVTVSFSRLRINHYMTRSEQEQREKLAAPMAANGKLRETWETEDKLSEVSDVTIAAYLPGLRDVLGAYV